jgi:hypothetical protein
MIWWFKPKRPAEPVGKITDADGNDYVADNFECLPSDTMFPPGFEQHTVTFTGKLHHGVYDAIAEMADEYQDAASYFLGDGDHWKPISRFAYDSLLEIGVDCDLLKLD